MKLLVVEQSLAISVVVLCVEIDIRFVRHAPAHFQDSVVVEIESFAFHERRPT